MKNATVSKIIPVGEQIYENILKLDFSKIKKCAVDKGFYTNEEIEFVEAEYKKYLAICFTFPELSFPTPLKIDNLWHQYILFTQDYADMCQSVAGRFLHHSPFVDKEESVSLDSEVLHQKYIMMFNETPSEIWSVNGLCSPNPNCEGKS